MKLQTSLPPEVVICAADMKQKLHVVASMPDSNFTKTKEISHHMATEWSMIPEKLKDKQKLVALQ